MIIQQPVGRLTIPEGASVILSVVATGTEPLFYQWKFYGLALPGATNATFTITNTIYGAGAGDYAVVVSNEAGSMASTVSAVGVLRAQLPQILQQPQSQTVRVGEAAFFTVTVDETWPVHYFWIRNGSSYVPEATNKTLSFPHAQLTDSGSYTVLVGNVSGAVTSAPAALKVEPAP